MTAAETTILAEGKHLRLVRRGGWEYAERTRISGIVAIIAVTDDRRLILVEQHREPVRRRVLEIPAGLAGDGPGAEDDSLPAAAQRELLEETGYTAAEMEPLFEGPPSAGMSTEIVTFFRARGLQRVSAGGGDSTEEIVVHVIPLSDVQAFLSETAARGVLIDPKVYAALYFAHQS